MATGDNINWLYLVSSGLIAGAISLAGYIGRSIVNTVKNANEKTESLAGKTAELAGVLQTTVSMQNEYKREFDQHVRDSRQEHRDLAREIYAMRKSGPS